MKYPEEHTERDSLFSFNHRYRELSIKVFDPNDKVVKQFEDVAEGDYGFTGGWRLQGLLCGTNSGGRLGEAPSKSGGSLEWQQRRGEITRGGWMCLKKC